MTDWGGRHIIRVLSGADLMYLFAESVLKVDAIAQLERLAEPRNVRVFEPIESKAYRVAGEPRQATLTADVRSAVT